MATIVTTSPTTRVRSPNYPTISLREAVARVRPIWEHQHRHPTDRQVIAQILGYTSLNGASMALISALTKYGLLEAAGREQLRVSDDAVNMILHEPGEPERAEAVQRAAFSPALFHDLHERFGDDPPSDHGLRALLVKRNFNPRTVDGVIRSYRDTLGFLAEESAGIDMVSEEELESEGPPMQTATPAQTAVAPPARGGGASTENPSPPEPHRTTRRLSVPLGRSITAEVVFQGGEVTPRELDALRRYLDVWKGFIVNDDSDTDDGEGFPQD